MLKKILFILICLSVFLSVAYANQTNNDRFLPKWETEEEKARHDEIGKNLRETPPPEGDVSCPGEFDYCEGVLYAWEGYESLLADLIDATQEEAIAWVVVDNASEQGDAESYLLSHGVPLDNVEFLIIPTNSIWMRDYGPWGIYLENGDRAINDPVYNRPRPLDDALPGELGDLWDMNVYEPDWVHPGGNFMCDGKGVGFSTTLVYEENPGWDEEYLEQMSSDYLGIDDWHALSRLPESIEYTGHCDMFTKLLDDHTVIVGEYPDGHPGAAVLDDNAAYFESITNGNGDPFEVHRIPMASSDGACRSYTNSLIINDRVLVPIYGESTDQAALQVYEDLMPDHEILDFNCSNIIMSGGAIHCISMQFPGALKWAFEGTIESGSTREYLSDVEVYTSGDNLYTALTDEDGFFHIPVNPGTYTLHANRFGYYDWDSEQEYTFDDPDTVALEIVMQPMPSGVLSGYVTDINENPIEGAEITPLGVPVDPVYTDGTGYYEFSEIPGDYTYDIKVYAPDFDWQEAEITVPPDEEVTLDFELMPIQSFELSDGDFVGEGEWEWGIPQESGGPADAYMGEKCWGTDLDDDYNATSNYSLFSSDYTINNSAEALLKFYHWYDTEDGWDGGNVQISFDDGENWDLISPEDGYPDNSVVALTGQPGFSGNSDGWKMVQFDISELVSDGDVIKFRFRFASTNSQNPGWFIDNVVVYGTVQEPSAIGDENGFNAPAQYSLAQNFPNPFNPITRINYQLPKNSDVTLSIYNTSGQLIKTLVDAERDAGYHSVVWDGTDTHGATVSSGVYIYRIRAKDFVQEKRCIMLK